MTYKKTDYLYLPVRDFIINSPVLEELGWTNRVIAALIRSRVCMEGRCDTNYGGWHTSKHAILQAIKLRNQTGLAPPIDLQMAYRLISPVGLPPRLTGS